MGSRFPCGNFAILSRNQNVVKHERHFNYTLTPAKAVRYRPQWFSRRHYEYRPVDHSTNCNFLDCRRTHPRRAVVAVPFYRDSRRNKEGKLKLMWGEGTLGGTKGAAKFESMINKMFGTNIKISFTPGRSDAADGQPNRG